MGIQVVQVHVIGINLKEFVNKLMTTLNAQI
jgi:hypothetical protein